MRFWTAVAVALVVGTAACADPIEGMWQTVADDNGNSGLIQITPCGAAFCGTLVKAFDASGQTVASDNVGKKIIWDMLPAGDGAYDSGKVWSPDRNKTYDSKLKLTGDQLAVRGCVFGICRDGGVWSRVN